MLYPRRHPVTDHIKRMVPAPSAKLKDPTQAREQRFPCLQNSRQRCQSSELPLPICRGSRETHEWRAVLTEKIRHTNSSLRMSCHTALKTVHSRKGSAFTQDRSGGDPTSGVCTVKSSTTAQRISDIDAPQVTQFHGPRWSPRGLALLQPPAKRLQDGRQ
jgi:hypothetical protein